MDRKFEVGQDYKM